MGLGERNPSVELGKAGWSAALCDVQENPSTLRERWEKALLFHGPQVSWVGETSNRGGPESMSNFLGKMPVCSPKFQSNMSAGGCTRHNGISSHIICFENFIFLRNI